MVAFVRQLASQPGVQLNPLKDGSDAFTPDNSDQVFAIAMRARRGRIDRPFRVNRGTFLRKLGAGEPIRANALNEAHVQVFEALNNGAAEAVVHRLVTAEAELNYIIATVTAGNIGFSTSADVPPEALFGLKHLECFNDGVSVEVSAETVLEGGVAVATSLITLRVREPNGNIILDVTGSLLSTAKDDFGQSLYLPDVIEATQTIPDFEIEISGTPSPILPTSNAYGRDANGRQKAAKSAVLFYFTEGATTYVQADYTLAATRLSNTELQFFYVITGGSQAPALINVLAGLAFDRNKLLAVDIDGALTPAQAITFAEGLGIDSHYVRFFWAPIRGDDPLNGGKALIGTAGLNTAFACLRNAATDANGFAAKNRAIGGKAYPINRTGMRQVYDPSENELSDLAKAKINPVIFQRYNGGGAFVFSDVLTAAKTEGSLRKLTTVADMSVSIDDVVTRYGKEILLFPMSTAVARMKAFLQTLFESAQSANWIVPSSELDGQAFRFTVAPNAQRPVDRMDITYSLRYDGTVRQIFVQQTITR